MACGTPVLATSIGGIPDLIKDELTGFLMRDNTPECIAENVIRALQFGDLGLISENARAMVTTKYCFEAALERYRLIIQTAMELTGNQSRR
jgi:glycosyltransferase involved in cell wall biosynthesis